jgi:hypothetical protein
MAARAPPGTGADHPIAIAFSPKACDNQSMSAAFTPVFTRLREILQKHRGNFAISRDTTESFGFEAPIGPATIKAWKGKAKKTSIPIAWVEIGKNYVSYHLMGVYGNPKLLEDCSPKLRARMQGKSCFNFTNVDEALFSELDALTGKSVHCFQKAGFVTG